MAIPKNVILTAYASQVLQDFVKDHSFDKIVFLVDENSDKYCLPKLELDFDIHKIQVKSGETQKNLATCQDIWRKMTNLKLTRKSLMINLGGGVITDMGGFVAATYKRGIHFCNIPTTLLAQVDASIGGKVGVDFEGLKNHIGVFQQPDLVILDTAFLSTLDQRQLRSGFAEVIKHGLIYDHAYWQTISEEKFDENRNWNTLLERSVFIKGEVVSKDPLERGLRKILNFGHTLGHAIETYFLEKENSLLHGEAIAVGMILEAKLSEMCLGLTNKELLAISGYIAGNYQKVALPPIQAITDLLQQDKKNEGNQVNFSLLESIGKCAWDTKVPDSAIENGYEFYNALYE